MGHWAFSWVQIIAHNKKSLLFVSLFVTSFLILGLSFISFASHSVDMLLLVVGMLMMAGTVAWFLDSPKMGLLQLLLSCLVMAMLLGAAGWLRLAIDANSILGLMVVITILSSNLVHILSTLSREMARGLFQFDGIAEAIKLNTSPIFLSNFTTAMGFVVAAMVQPELTNLAYLVLIGVLLSFMMTLTWLPLIVLSWLLEFRVGNTADRKGLTYLAKFLQDNPHYRKIILATSVLFMSLLLVINGSELQAFNEFVVLLSVFVGLFWVAWQSLKLALLNVLSSLFALLISLSLVNYFMELHTWSALLWLAPMGIIIDDGIHFFARFARAKQTVFGDSQSAVIFAMASVARPIWITSWVLLIGLLILMLSNSMVVQEAALLTITALVVTAVLILLVVPALLMSAKK